MMAKRRISWEQLRFNLDSEVALGIQEAKIKIEKLEALRDHIDELEPALEARVLEVLEEDDLAG